jgi:hypothetical protein
MSLPRAALLAVLLFAPLRGQALGPTLLSAGTLEPGQTGVHGAVGFPYLDVRLLRGVVPGLDVGLVGRAAWADVQRLGLLARWRFAPGLALRAGVDGWFRRPASTRWIDITGEQDLTGALAVTWSFATPRGTILTFEGALLGIGTTRPRSMPLDGPPPAFAVGTSSAVRFGAEVPNDGGLVLTLQVGADLHLSGFDGALAMPVFALGVGYR